MMTYTGTLMIGYQPCVQRKLVNFFRFVTTCHPPRTFEDMDHVIREIETEGENIKVCRLELPVGETPPLTQIQRPGLLQNLIEPNQKLG